MEFFQCLLAMDSLNAVRRYLWALEELVGCLNVVTPVKQVRDTLSRPSRKAASQRHKPLIPALVKKASTGELFATPLCHLFTKKHPRYPPVGSVDVTPIGESCNAWQPKTM
ncbi:hypothetical protein D3C78_1289500 [compost metagenome]